ncbi:hypothetical protein [Brevundimonas sp.]|uniref:hypothetical protein n=1 Tax=Brevundimonas sp. TaxID=1871086 RepID=UPI0028A0AB8C|nr:hypothetical protein [Brevundimonas sp.]
MLIEGALALSLLCNVTYDLTDTATTSFSNTPGDMPSHGKIETTRTHNGQLYVEIDDEGSRIRLPDRYITRSDDGWRTLTQVTSTESSIDGRFSFRTTIGGRMEIDRMTGNIRASIGNFVFGYVVFRGSCDRYEAPTERRF